MKGDLRQLQEEFAEFKKRSRYEMRRLVKENARLKEALIAKALISRDDLIRKPERGK